VVAEQPYDGRLSDAMNEDDTNGFDVLQSPPRSGSNALLSTFDVNGPDVSAGQIDGAMEIKLLAGRSAMFVGEYLLEVLEGVVSVYGALLHPGSGAHHVYAPSTHALPQVVARTDDTSIRICSLPSSLKDLDKLSPLFRNIWTEPQGSSFSLLHTLADDALQRSVVPLEVEKPLQAVLSRLALQAESNARHTRIMAIGSKSSGKSTLNRLLCNTITTRSKGKHCLYLDLDPGQPEFGPPGQISLVDVKGPILGPPFTHPASSQSKQYRVLRSHTIAATTFRDDAAHYLFCARDLVQYADRRHPLIVNSSGWVSGLGSSVLIDLISILSISDAVLLEPVEAAFTQWLQRDCTDVTCHRLPRQPSRPSSRTPAETRSMQTMAYMHHKYGSSNNGIRWSTRPLSSFRPWTVSYAGDDPSIYAIVSYGQEPSLEFLSEVLDGSLVAIVAIEENSLPEAFDSRDPAQPIPEFSPFHSTGPGAPTSEDSIQRTAEGLPYVSSNVHGYCTPLNPSVSECIGLALIRSIDTEAQQLQLVTPLSEDEIAVFMRKKVVLVRGGFDPPGWAYLEDIYSKDNAVGELHHDRPWVSKKDMVGIEGAVWRLRHPPMASAVAFRQT